MVLIAILFPPLYFLLKGRWIGFFLTALMFVAAIACCVLVILVPIALILWALAALAALWDRQRPVPPPVVSTESRGSRSGF